MFAQTQWRFSHVAVVFTATAVADDANEVNKMLERSQKGWQTVDYVKCICSKIEILCCFSFSYFSIVYRINDWRVWKPYMFLKKESTTQTERETKSDGGKVAEKLNFKTSHAY